MLDNFSHLHFIGIGGSGISALAHLALAEGKKVSGSDIGANQTTEGLKQEGATIYLGHAGEHVTSEVNKVIYSEAIDKSSNPEYLEAQKRGIPCCSYFEALGEWSANKKTIVVTGTHGKTTTTAMLGVALAQAGEDPTVIVGSRVPAFGNRNVRIGNSEWMVAEGCEYRRNFMSFQPFGVVLLNCEWEHVDYYKTGEDYIKAFKELVTKIPAEGFLVYNGDDENCKLVSDACKGLKISVSRKSLEKIKLKVAGEFNQLNASEALQAAMRVTENRDGVMRGLEHFSGTARRMEVKGERDGILVMDDYGHHPTEVRETLKAIKEAHPNSRLICVFQPHQYSRTYELLDQFVTAFGAADKVIIPNIFEARDTEDDKKRISAEKLVEAISKQHNNCLWGESFEKTLEILKKEVRQGDLIVTMGAGDVYKVGEKFLSERKTNLI